MLVCMLSMPFTGWWLVHLVGWPLGQTWLLGSSVIYSVATLVLIHRIGVQLWDRTSALLAITLYFEASGGSYTAIVDAAGQIAESNEGNNSRSYTSPTPSPPARCTSPKSRCGPANGAALRKPDLSGHAG